MTLSKYGRAAALSLSCLISATAHTADQRASELEQLRTRIRQITAQVNQDKAQQNSVRDQLESLEGDMAELSRSLTSTQAKISSSKRKIETSESDFRKYEQELVAHKSQLEKLILATYVAGRAEYFKMMLNQEDPGKLGRNMAYYRYFSRARVDDIVRIQELATGLATLKSKVEFEYGELKALETTQLSQQKTLNVARVDRAALLKKLNQQIDSNEEELERLKQNAARLERLLRDLADTLPNLPTEVPDSRSFSTMQGKLPLPVAGRISARFGQYKGDTGIPWEGIFMDAVEGTTVHAIFPGRVAFADWLRGFGLLLILDHGDGFMSLYSHNQVLHEQVGEWVEAGEAVAQVGASGGLTKTGLYFEIRHNGEPRNPLIWCKVQ